jgi:hypothetical protein
MGDLRDCRHDSTDVMANSQPLYYRPTESALLWLRCYGRHWFNAGTLPLSRPARRRAVPVGAPT